MRALAFLIVALPLVAQAHPLPYAHTHDEKQAQQQPAPKPVPILRKSTTQVPQQFNPPSRAPANYRPAAQVGWQQFKGATRCTQTPDGMLTCDNGLARTVSR